MLVVRPLLFSVLLLTVGCGGVVPREPEVETAGDLLYYLALQGYQVAAQPGLDEDPTLHGSGRVYAVAEAGTLVLFAYPSASAADQDALGVAGRGARAGSSVLFQRGALLVLYQGESGAFARSLERALGPPRY